jgi:hypothetical protein
MERKAASKIQVLTEADLRRRQHAPTPIARSARPKPTGQRPRRPFDKKPISPTALSAVPPAPVLDNFPSAIPVGGQELDVIETYLGALLDELVGPRE